MFEIAVIIALITGLCQIVKQFLPTKYMPLASLALGIAAGFFFVGGTIQEHVFYGLAIGLAACGVFDVAKIPTKKTK